MDHVTGKSRGYVSGFQTIATCRDGLKNSRDKSATSPLERRRNGEMGDLRDKTRGLSSTRRRQINGDVSGLWRTCRRHRGEVGIVEFGLNRVWITLMSILSTEAAIILSIGSSAIFHFFKFCT